jgi:uncharacterized protein with ParB-like and HNH nuclease domain
MQVSKQPIYQFLEGSGKSFVVPVYQRDYAWNTHNCAKLWQDLLELQQTQKPTYFLGTIVCINSNFQEYVIVDGQQRLTTTSLLLLALHNYLKQKPNKDPIQENLTELLLDFLVNKHSLDKSKRIRLKPNKQDKDYFEQLFNFEQLFKNKEIKSIDSNITQNYSFFYNKIKTESVNLNILFDLFRKLEIVLINLDRGVDDPQLIFESLNSTGVDLTDGDLIRNYILMDLDSTDQEHLYLDYWLRIENLSLDTAEFIRNFLMFRLNRSITQTKRAVYSEFKKYTDKQFAKNPQKTLSELLKYAQIYSYFIRTNKHPNKNVDKGLERLYKLEFKVAYPFLFEIFDLLELGTLDQKNVADILQIIESHAFRKILVNNTTQGLNKFFLTLDKEIKKLEPKNWQKQYLEILKFIFISKSGNQKFPTDQEFVEALSTKEIYKLRSKNRDFLLAGLENYNSAYSVDLQDLTVEHILPQNPSKWKKSLGENWQEIRSKYLHTLGNLTLTAQNSKLSNKDFRTKQEIDLHTSKLKLSYKLGEQESWNQQKILERSQKLAKEATQIWRYPKTDYYRLMEEKEIYTLDEDINFTSTKPKALYFGNKKFEVKHWRDILRIVCDQLYQYSPTKLNLVIQNSELQKYFDLKQAGSKSSLKDPIPFNNNKVVEGNQSANAIVGFGKKLCDLIDFDKSQITIFL